MLYATCLGILLHVYELIPAFIKYQYIFHKSVWIKKEMVS